MKLQLPPHPSSSPFWWFWERFTDFHAAVYKASHGRLGGTYGKAPVALVESIGRKSGEAANPSTLCNEDGENIVVRRLQGRRRQASRPGTTT